MDRTREERTREERSTVDTFSLEQLESLLAKFGDSAAVNEELQSRHTLSLVLPPKDHHPRYQHQPEKNSPRKVAENEPPISQVAGRSQEERSPTPQFQVGLPSVTEDTSRCVLLRKKTLNRTLLALLISAVSTGMVLPFYLIVGTAIHERVSTSGFDFTYNEACLSDGGPSPHTYNDSCHVYENGICDSYLKTEGPTNLTTLHSTLISEEDVVAFFSALDTRSTPSCVAASKSFICQYVFPPCHNDGDYQLITEEQCLYVQDEACVVEWLLAKSLFPNLIPDCRLLNGASAVLDNSTVTCPDNFKLFCESCLPLCSSFSQYDKVTTSIRKIVDITAAVIAIVGGLLLIILSAMRRKTMWQFPAVFTVYTAMCPMTIAIFVIISHIDHNKDLYCSHEVLTQAIEEPTVFCNISGGVFQFCLMLMSSFWLLHLFHVYLSIVFPIRSRFLKTKKWSQRLHIAEVVGSIFISALCPAVVLATNINYNLIFYPPLLCTPATQISVFYSMTIPVVLVTVIGLNLIVTVVWTLFKRNICLNIAITGRRCIIRAPEVKTMILLAFYAIFLSTTIVFVGKGVSNARPFRENLFAYFICQLHGDDPACYVFQEEYYKYESSELTSAIFGMIGLINWINLIFAVQIQDIKIILYKVSSKVYCLYGISTKFTFTSNSPSKPTHSSTNSV